MKVAPGPWNETETLAALRSGRTSLALVLQRDDDTANGLRAAQVLRALPRYRPDQITTVMAAIGISEEHRLGDLSQGRRNQLLTAIGTVRPAASSSYSPQPLTPIDKPMKPPAVTTETYAVAPAASPSEDAVQGGEPPR